VTKSEFNKDAAKEIGALEALATVKPDAKDHAAMFAFCEKQRTHQLNLLTTLVTYVGNGMAAEISDETADRVIAYMKDNQQVFMLMTPETFSAEIAKQLQVLQSSNKHVQLRGKSLPITWRMVKGIGMWTVGILMLLNLLFGRISFADIIKFCGIAGAAG
jgi:hypothetical protein